MEAFDGESLLAALTAASAWLDAHIDNINALNVFPVPDGDTGTNMSLTMRAALDETKGVSRAMVSDLVRAVAHGALMGARGNSGVILSQILRGFAKTLDGQSHCDALIFAQALSEGAATAYKGVMKPVEGTILTVIRETAEAALACAEAGASLQDVVDTSVQAAHASVERTPSLLPVLAEAGVVDAGGQGLYVLLEGILRYLRGESVTIRPASSSIGIEEHVHAPEGEYNYDTQFVIVGERLDVNTIREAIAQMGDSVLVVGDEHTVKVHVHSDNPGRVIDYGIAQGQVTSVIVENMQLQYEAFKAASQSEKAAAAPRAPAPRLSDTSVVAVVSGEGLRQVFESLGVDAIIPGGQTMNPSTQDLLAAIESVSGEAVIVLPNNSNVILAAEQAKTLTHKHVAVVATKTIPQGIAALLAFNYQADLDTNVRLMSAASQQVQTIEVTRAVRSVQVNGLDIGEGQFIGLLNGDLVTVGKDAPSVAASLLADVGLASYEIVTIYYGADVSEQEAQPLAEAIRGLCDAVEVEVLSGGQAHYHYILSVE